MAYNETLAMRIRSVLGGRSDVTEKRMFGGLTFMVGDKMCCGIVKDDLMLRMSIEEYEQALTHPHTRPMDFTSRPSPGFLYVGPSGYQGEGDLRMWLDKSLAYVQSLPAKKAPGKRKAKG